jgi:hypothetical protein
MGECGNFYERRETYSTLHGVIYAPQLREVDIAFPSAQPEFDPKSGHVGFVVNNMTLGAGFLTLIWFPLPILIPPTTARSLIIP